MNFKFIFVSLFVFSFTVSAQSYNPACQEESGEYVFKADNLSLSSFSRIDALFANPNLRQGSDWNQTRGLKVSQVNRFEKYRKMSVPVNTSAPRQFDTIIERNTFSTIKQNNLTFDEVEVQLDAKELEALFWLSSTNLGDTNKGNLNSLADVFFYTDYRDDGFQPSFSVGQLEDELLGINYIFAYTYKHESKYISPGNFEDVFKLFGYVFNMSLKGEKKFVATYDSDSGKFNCIAH